MIERLMRTLQLSTHRQTSSFSNAAADDNNGDLLVLQSKSKKRFGVKEEPKSEFADPPSVELQPLFTCMAVDQQCRSQRA